MGTVPEPAVGKVGAGAEVLGHQPVLAMITETERECRSVYEYRNLDEDGLIR